MSIDFSVPIPFVDHLGMTLERFEDGQSEVHYRPRPEHGNSFGVAHGGALMTFLDVVMAHAARSTQPADFGAVTIEMKTSFMRPALLAPDAVLRGLGQLMHRTRSMAFVEGRILDAQGQLCAQATGTFKFVPRPATDASPAAREPKGAPA